jgi:hypothetical protein
MLKLLVLVVAVGCAQSGDDPPLRADPPAAAPTGSDPWAAATPGSPGNDPWGPGSSASDPWAPTATATAGASADPKPATPASPQQPALPALRPPPPASGAASALAGSYDCSMLSSGSRTGRYQTDYVPSVMGRFQIADNGTYSSATFPAKGTGRISADAGTVTFQGGPYAGFIGRIGSVSSGTTIRFGGVQTQAPTPSVHFNDHVCYRK